MRLTWQVNRAMTNLPQARLENAICFTSDRGHFLRMYTSSSISMCVSSPSRLQQQGITPPPARRSWSQVRGLHAYKWSSPGRHGPWNERDNDPITLKVYNWYLVRFQPQKRNQFGSWQSVDYMYTQVAQMITLHVHVICDVCTYLDLTSRVHHINNHLPPGIHLSNFCWKFELSQDSSMMAQTGMQLNTSPQGHACCRTLPECWLTEIVS